MEDKPRYHVIVFIYASNLACSLRLSHQLHFVYYILTRIVQRYPKLSVAGLDRRVLILEM
jgi:hypothetical protein